ncbi:hypothetical protein J1605_023172 [Eschrichtius robustus]|uniref:Uncharacterized protein n=1 Tax=Eschrichtius robustus TaxID=9764 RepID=A0AB34H2C2_ESCRO|nr:hypothetical protein J1605_023172 [Eschrichtius robustus]
MSGGLLCSVVPLGPKWFSLLLEGPESGGKAAPVLRKGQFEREAGIRQTPAVPGAVLSAARSSALLIQSPNHPSQQLPLTHFTEGRRLCPCPSAATPAEGPGLQDPILVCSALGDVCDCQGRVGP